MKIFFGRARGPDREGGSEGQTEGRNDVMPNFTNKQTNDVIGLFTDDQTGRGIGTERVDQPMWEIHGTTC